MQRPRRTSEFHEEPGTATKRQSRLAPNRFTSSIGLTPVAGTTSRYSSRQTTSATGSATRGRAWPTPQKTPLSASGGPQRSLFSAEKKRNAANIALHNDKKWIHDQTQRITEYLRNAYSPGVMANISEDFFARNNCLKQMSIKQFVGIINYFLQFIVGNRFVVGTNYVEDIINILQKINYPYPVNKSWLKTPTHSLGNLIVLFDYFMDFVPLSSTNDDEFELETLKADDQTPDLEFKKLLLKNCQQSFQLWDKQLDAELEKVKRQTADVLIQKRHNLAGVDAIENEIAKLSSEYQQLLNEQILIDPEDEKLCQQLRKHVKASRMELETFIELDETLKNQLNDISQKKAALCKEVTQLENIITEIQSALKQQECSVKDRDAYMEKIKLLRLEFEAKQRTMLDLQIRDENKKSELLIAQRKITDQIESVNGLLRDLIGILGLTDDKKQFYISMDSDLQNIQRLGPLITQIRCKLEPKLQKAKKQLQIYEEEIKEKNLLKQGKLQPEFEAKKDAYEKAKQKLEAFELRAIEESKLLFAKNQELIEQRNACKIENEELANCLAVKRKELKRFEQNNEETMAKFEKEYKILSTARRARLDAWKTNLNECAKELEALFRLIGSDADDCQQ